MVKHHEGVRNKPYLCPAKLWTVGVGHVLYPEQANIPVSDRIQFKLRPEDARIWSDAEVDYLLAKDLARFERGVARLCPNTIGNQGRFDSLVSFSFNVGLGNLQRSSLRMKNNRGEFEEAADEFMKWIKGGGRVLPGLVKRRMDERALYLSGVV
jgi:GH24 family phage-related lysozyme (muramidase)